MKIKKIIFIILSCFWVSNFIYSDTDTQNDDFIVSIDGDENSTNSKSDESNNVLPKKQKTYFDNLIVDLPRQEYAEKYVAWLTTEKALEFNSTEGMQVKSVAQYFKSYNEYVNKKKDKDEKIYHYFHFVKNKDNNDLIASFTIDSIDYFRSEGTLRYVVATNLENMGYGTKVMRIMIEKAFDELGLYRLIATVAPDNIASIKIFEKFGFKREGLLRKSYIVKGGKRIDMIQFSMLKEEWDEFKKNEKDIIKYKNVTNQNLDNS